MGNGEAEEDNQEAGGNKRRRRSRQANGDVPMVKDAVQLERAWQKVSKHS